jgi:hypothetical protein
MGIRSEVITAGRVGFNSTAINSATDSSNIPTDGYNQITLEFVYVRSAGTDVQFYIKCLDKDDTEFYLMHPEDTGSGSISYYKKLFTLEAAGASLNAQLNLPINCHKLRLEAVEATGSPDGNDKLTVVARLANLT